MAKRWERLYLEYQLSTPTPPEPKRLSTGQIMHNKWAPRRELVFDLRLYGCEFKVIGEYVGITTKRAQALYAHHARRIAYRSRWNYAKNA